MKYFTKEWYELCQKTSLHPLEASKEAERFSEEYYRTLYQEQLKEYLEEEKEISSVSFDELFPETIDKAALKGMTKDEIEAFKVEYYADREKAQQNFEPEPYDPEKLTQDFEEAQTYNIAYAQRLLPEEILSQIADIRVFALGKASKRIVHQMKRYVFKNEKAVEKVLRDYQSYEKSLKGKIDEDILTNMVFHDCIVTDAAVNEDVLEICFDICGGFTDINRIRFDGCRIVEQDAPIKSTRWLYEEIYPEDNGYEIHILLSNDEQEDLIDLILFARHIQFFRDIEV